MTFLEKVDIGDEPTELERLTRNEKLQRDKDRHFLCIYRAFVVGNVE
jgi:hypothetical protein